jgi:hypothetical protein
VVLAKGAELLFRDDLTLSEWLVGRQVVAWARFRGENLRTKRRGAEDAG